ncbi:MAG: glycosyltransferase family 2 protein [bacterium]
MKKYKILVAIPTFNCEQQISRVLNGFDKELLARIDKVIVIDNISSDKTVEVAKKTIAKIDGKKFEVWKNKKNYNLGGTHKVAFLTGERLGMDYVAILHGDDQAKTTELNLLIDVAENNSGLGAVLGCRFMSGSKLSGYSWQRIWGNRVINIAYTLFALRPSNDLGSGLNLFKISSLLDHKYLSFGDTITFNIDLLLYFFSKKTLIKFVPITWREEDQVSNARNFTVGSTALKKLFSWRIGILHYSEKNPQNYQSGKV